MPFPENLRRIIATITKKRSEPTGELSGGKNIQLWDLRELDKAKERGVEPGYYFTINPITKSELDDSLTLQTLSFFFHQKLQEAGLQEPSGTKIALNNEHTMFIDPAQGWLFSPSGYIPDLQMLVVRADNIDRDKVQGIIVNALK
jgi:hypothetical protein